MSSSKVDQNHCLDFKFLKFCFCFDQMHQIFSSTFFNPINQSQRSNKCVFRFAIRVKRPSIALSLSMSCPVLSADNQGRYVALQIAKSSICRRTSEEDKGSWEGNDNGHRAIASKLRQ